MMALLSVPVAAHQRGVVSGVVVPQTPAQVGVPVAITVTGTNPCGAVRIDPGDGTERVTHAIVEVPTTIRYVYRKPGRFQVGAEGMGNCDGVVAVAIQVNPAPAPPPSAAPPPVAPPPASPPPTVPPGRVRAMDTDRDGVVTRAEWRGSDQAFRNHDTNRDGVLSGAEVRDEPDGVIVKAAERWTSTGVYVRKGDVVRIESSGMVQLSADAADTSSPGGAGSGRRAPSAPLPDRPAGGLIARIGNSPPLFVGADSTLRANATGLLFLGVNDDHVPDNRGEFRVKVSVPSGGRQRR
jgi:hypothetical protein